MAVNNKNNDLMFEFFDQKIIISQQRDIYNSLRHEFEDIINQGKEDFINLYSRENSTIDDVSQRALKQGNSIIEGVLSEVVGKLVDMGFYNIDKDIFFDEYYADYYDYDEYYNKVNDQYMDIVLTEEQKDQYRKMRRESRSRWQGGGFGVGGALKGAAKAGAMNMATGALHGAFNLGGKFVSSIGASMKKSSLFSNPDTLNTLVEGIESSLYGFE